MAKSMAVEPKEQAAVFGASALTREQKHRILVAAAAAAAIDGPFRILSVTPSPEAENRWAKSGRFRNRAQRPPKWEIQSAASWEPEPPREQGGQTS